MERLSAPLFVLALWAAFSAVPLTARQPDAGVREATPELFYLKDESGRLVPVPGFRYRDFVELFRLREGLAGPAQPPAATIERLDVRIDARAAASQQAWPATVACVIRQSRSGWVPLPLGLRGLLLDGPPEHEGPGSIAIDSDPDGGIRCWFDLPETAGPDGRQVVRLSGRIAVDVSSVQDSLALELPQAVTSRVEVITTRPAPAVSLTPASAGHVEITPDEDGGLVVITGLSGDVRFRITDAAAGGGPSASAQVECDSVVRIAGRTATIEARLALAGIPPGTSRLRVTPPPGMTVRGVAGDAALFGRGGPRETPFIDLVVTAAADGRAAIVLEAEGPVDPSGKTPFEPLGFAIDGIEGWRQWGRTSLVVDGEWQASWDDTAGLRRVDPPLAQREPGFVAAFAYDAQPADLAVRIRPRRSRVVIEPEYRYDVSKGRVTLSGRLRVAARGAAVGGLSLSLDPAWSLRDVGPASLVDAVAVRVDAGQVTIPFLQPLAGDAVIEFTAAMPVAADDETVAWNLPAPRADLVGPAAIVITADSDIELSPDGEASVGLVRQTASAVPLADAGRIALAYRLDAAEGRFVAARRFLPRRVEASVAAEVGIDDQRAAVEETIRLNVMHVPLEFLELTVPEAAVMTGSFEVRQGPELLDAVEINRVPDADGMGMPLVSMRALLPVPLLGEGTVTVRYAMPVPPIPREATVAIDLPLALPVASGIARQMATLADDGGLTVSMRGDAWRRDVAGRGRSWSAPKPQHGLPLAVTERVREATSGTVVEAAWLQTRLYPQTREDIATYVLAGATGSFAIDLAASDAPLASCEVRVDGRMVTTERQRGSRLVLDFGDEMAGPRLIEIRTTAAWGGTAAGLGLPWPLRLDPPGFPETVRQRRFFWEVITAADDHLLGPPSRWTSEQAWRREGPGWREAAIVSQDELAAWIRLDLPATLSEVGLLASDPRPEGSRRVYAGVGGPGRARLWVVPTWVFVLVSSGLVLALGLAAVTRPAWRKPWLAVGLTAAAVLAASVAPGFAPLVGQAAVPGCVLVLLAAGLRRLTNRSPASRTAAPIIVGSPSSLTRTAAPTVSLLVTPSAADPRRDPR